MTRTQNEEPPPPPPPTTQTNTSSRRAGSAKSRLAAVSNATRPKMNARALVSGPSGSGKTWTMLSIASVLVEPVVDGERTILVIDTEKESALTYADNFTFRHLPWRPPFDPGELAEVLDAIPFDFPAVELVIVDSLTHFWRGTGGTLEIADGKFGGWKEARPVQDRLVEAMLTLPRHLLIGVRSKMEYLVGANGREVSKVGLAPVQSEDLVYEMNVALDIDMNHRIEVVKSRTPAVPVGRMYPAGSERKAAEDYADWLAGGVPPAPGSEVEALKARLVGVVDKEARIAIKAEFVTTFGMPDSLTADQVDPANAWITMMLDALDDDETTQTTQEGPRDRPEGDGPVETTDHAAEPVEDATSEPTPPDLFAAREELVAAEVESLKKLSSKDLTDALTEAGLPTSGPTEARRRRLAEHLVGA